MSGAKEIRTKIGSVKGTQKITRAMELVAASKMRKAQDRMQVSRPYATKIRQVIGHLAKGHTEFTHPYMEEREIKRAAYIVISSDRGLCGALNTALFRQVIKVMKKNDEAGIAVDICTIGVKASSFFNRFGGNVVAHAAHLGDEPQVKDLIGIVKVVLDAFAEGSLDAVYLCSNKFVNTMKQDPTIQQLLPLVQTEEQGYDYYWDYIYEPEAKELLEMLINRYIETQVYQAVVENIACFQSAQMVAMKNATENAGQVIEDLQLAYNKARQAAITQEISEIVAGADAVSE